MTQVEITQPLPISWRNRYLTASRYTLIEQARNRMAIILLVGFVPIWYLILAEITPPDLVAFKLWSSGKMVQVNGHNLVLISSGLNALTMVIGFIIFTSTRRDTPFDRRLILSGYPQSVLILAKLTSIMLISGLVSLYATGVLYLFWQPSHPVLIWLGFFSSGLIYGGLGLLLGVLLKGELEGFFLVMMISLMDTLLQNPIGNPAANKEFLKYFPSYSSMQWTVAGEFTSTVLWQYFLFSLAWFVGFALLGLLIFYWKTRSAVQTGPASQDVS
jgi:ABC-2 type transport system permease protein